MSLTPSTRIILIQEIAHRLATSDWALIDLTLSQFGLPSSDTWNGNRSSYVIEKAKVAEDAVLIELGLHVGYEVSSRPQPELTSWREDSFRLFISHLSAKRGYAGELQEELCQFGVSCFVAHKDIEPTKEWLGEIETALATCDALLGLVSPGFHESKWTDQELGYAMGRQLLVATARLGADPKGFVGQFQALEGNGKDPSALARDVFEILRDHRLTSERISDAVVECFARSNSFRRAKDNMALLEELKYWGPSLSSKARAALEENTQIKDAYGVPSRLERLLARMEQSDRPE